MENLQSCRRIIQSSVIACAALAMSSLPGMVRAAPPVRKVNAVQLTRAWDKKFTKSEKVDHQKVTFKNRYGITLAGDLYLPKDRNGKKLAALAVSGPFGAVQSSGLYAQTMAERGYVTLAFRCPGRGPADSARDAGRHHGSRRPDVLRLLPHASRLP